MLVAPLDVAERVCLTVGFVVGLFGLARCVRSSSKLTGWVVVPFVSCHVPVTNAYWTSISGLVVEAPLTLTVYWNVFVATLTGATVSSIVIVQPVGTAGTMMRISCGCVPSTASVIESSTTV